VSEQAIRFLKYRSFGDHGMRSPVHRPDVQQAQIAFGRLPQV
jgi:hypothetical protein